MKFSNGCWVMQESVECFSPQEAYFVTVTETQVSINAPTTRIRHRGDTLGGVNLTIKITSPIEDVIRVQTYHHMGTTQRGPEFELEQNACLPLNTTETDELLLIKSGSLELEINKKDWNMTYKRNGSFLTKSGSRDLALMKKNWRGLAYETKGDTEDTYMRQQLSLSVGELVYGLGERFTAFVKNGQSVDIYNEDGGTSTEQTYKNIPFYITNKGYGVFVNHPEKVSMEIASESVVKAEFSVEGGALDYFLIDGPSMKDVLRKYTDLTGKPSLPPAWTFGLWLSTSFTTNYDEATVMSFVDGMFERGIPLRTFHFDCFWMKEFHWSDLVWDSRVFPDPQGLLGRLKAKGLNICVWINSYIAQESRLFWEGKEKGYLVKRPNGDVWQWDMWQPGMALVDFTNPDACKWFQDHLEVLLDMGVDCFKTDFGERIPLDVVYHDGSDPKKMHNYYTYLYNKCVFDLLERKRGKGEAVLFARSATAGGQKFPVHWGGDCWSDYESMEESLRGGLSLMMSGFGFWAHDIGGFEQTSTADVYKRWVAFGLMSSHSRLHGSSSYRVPWTYDEEAVDVLRFFTKLKSKLMPYLFQTAIDTSNTGISVMRSMVMEFMEDRNCSYLDKQYLFGESLLVAPVFNEDSIAEFYLPEGRWTDFFSNEVYVGGKWFKEDCGYLDIPLMVRPGSIIAIGNQEDGPEYDYADGVELRVYEPIDGVKTCASVSNMKTETELTVEIMKETNTILIKTVATTQKAYTIRLINLKASNVSEGTFNIDGNDTLLSCMGSQSISLSLS